MNAEVDAIGGAQDNVCSCVVEGRHCATRTGFLDARHCLVYRDGGRGRQDGRLGARSSRMSGCVTGSQIAYGVDGQVELFKKDRAYLERAYPRQLTLSFGRMHTRHRPIFPATLQGTLIYTNTIRCVKRTKARPPHRPRLGLHRAAGLSVILMNVCGRRHSGRLPR